jgi:hypothetical protein
MEMGDGSPRKRGSAVMDGVNAIRRSAGNIS